MWVPKTIIDGGLVVLGRPQCLVIQLKGFFREGLTFTEKGKNSKLYFCCVFVANRYNEKVHNDHRIILCFRPKRDFDIVFTSKILFSLGLNRICVFIV